GSVLGITADFLTVAREDAPLIDLALGDRAQRFVVRDAAVLAQALAERARPFSGRVSFLPLVAPTRATSDEGSSRGNRPWSTSRPVRMPTSSGGVPSHPGVVALAEHLVSCDHPDLEDLPHRLLARTLIVRDLDAARDIARHTSGYRMVTLQGELLEPD